jgi:hypothetical protein
MRFREKRRRAGDRLRRKKDQMILLRFIDRQA